MRIRRLRRRNVANTTTTAADRSPLPARTVAVTAVPLGGVTGATNVIISLLLMHVLLLCHHHSGGLGGWMLPALPTARAFAFNPPVTARRPAAPSVLASPARRALVSRGKMKSLLIPPVRPLLATPEMTTTDGEGIDGAAVGGGSRAAIDWVASQPLESLVPKSDALSICREILGDNSLLDEAEKLVESNSESLERRLRDESRTVREVLGEDVSNRILNAVRDLGDEEGGVYDSAAVRAFLGSDAVNDLFAKILYDGIYEFFDKIDVFGNIIGSLPIIGPIRNQIQQETKKSLDRTLGPLVRAFLGTYTKIAVGQAADFVLSPANRRAFGSANANLVGSILDRPVNALLPTTTGGGTGVGLDPVKIRREAFDALRDADLGEDGQVAKFLDWAYDLAGDKSVRDAVDVDAVLDASPTLRGTVDRLWDGAVHEASSRGGGSGGGGEAPPPSS